MIYIITKRFCYWLIYFHLEQYSSYIQFHLTSLLWHVLNFTKQEVPDGTRKTLSKWQYKCLSIEQISRIAKHYLQKQTDKTHWLWPQQGQGPHTIRYLPFNGIILHFIKLRVIIILLRELNLPPPRPSLSLSLFLKENLG